jgi:hypothetical protein
VRGARASGASKNLQSALARQKSRHFLDQPADLHYRFSEFGGGAGLRVSSARKPARRRRGETKGAQIIENKQFGEMA